MTWRDYINSEYNVFNSSYNDDFFLDHVWYADSLMMYVTPDDKIINNQTYQVEPY